MRNSFITVMLMAGIFAMGLSQSSTQTGFTEVELSISSDILRNGTVILEINGIQQEAEASENVSFEFPELFKGTTTFKVRYLGNTWADQRDLEGIGLVFLDLDKWGISPFEAAEATFKSQKADKKLNVLVNEKSVGTTECVKSVKPYTTHNVEWKRGDTTKCSTTINLPPGTQLSFTCDLATGKVTYD